MVFFYFFIIYSLIGCYNITVCNNITFISQANKMNSDKYISKIK